MKNILVIYHADCLDGLTAAYICGKELSFNNKVQFAPYKYQVKAPLLIGFTDVYILDFSFPRAEMFDLCLENLSVNFTIIDHHETAKDLSIISSTLANFDFRFDDRHSGAMLTWKYFHPECSFDCAPLFVKYIEDRDLWKWELPESKAISAYIRSLKLDLTTIGNIVDQFRDPTNVNYSIANGLILLEPEINYIREAIKEVQYLDSLGGYSDIPYVKVDRLASEVIEALYKKEDSPFAVGWREWENDQIKLEFRSKDFDVSRVAKSLGGGGHKTASGVHISREKARELGIAIDN